MLNRRILRIKAFKAIYSFTENQSVSLKDLEAQLDRSLESTRDLYLFLLCCVGPLTREARARLEAARGKFNPTEEELHPNLKFVRNGIAALLEQDPDFQKLLEKKKLSWDQNDAFVHTLYENLKTRLYYQAYMQDPEQSIVKDAALWKQVFENEFEDDETLWTILEDLSIHWSDDLPYVLGCVVRSLEEMGRTGRWTYPPLYQSDAHEFIRSLLTAAYGRYAEYYDLIAGSVSKWDQDRLYTTDIVLISMGLAEAETCPDIPLRVTINEYVEISKYYSTPKSRGFVNGLLDRLIKDRMAKGIINKTV